MLGGKSIIKGIRLEFDNHSRQYQDEEIKEKKERQKSYEIDLKESRLHGIRQITSADEDTK